MLVALKGEAHTAFEVISTVILSPFTSVDVMNVALFVPTLVDPFNFHWYTGVVPPFVGVAKKVTDTPGQITGVVVKTGDVETMLTDGATTAFTVIVNSLLVAVEVDGQGTLGVNITFTLSPCASAPLV